MAKIIAIDNQTISIGTNDGGIKEVRACDLNFVPHIGDEVEMFETETKIIVSKLEKSQPIGIPDGGINISLSNNSNVNSAPTIIPVSSGKVVNKLIYCILAFFFGGIGIHKFYAGRIGAGIAYIVFCFTFIPSFIAFVEFIIALTKKADANGNIIV